MLFNTDLNIKNLGETVTLNGWIQKKRDLGGVVFIDLRDRSGIMQLVVRPESPYYDLASTLKNEYCIKITGKVVKREKANLNIPTGEIEIEVETLELFSESLELPFDVTDNTTALEDTRLKYRYLDLRRPVVNNKLITRQDRKSVV